MARGAAGAAASVLVCVFTLVDMVLHFIVCITLDVDIKFAATAAVQQSPP
jgi:hypothetical protein